MQRTIGRLLISPLGTGLGGVLIRGEATDFLGQYRRNSDVVLTLRYSF